MKKKLFSFLLLAPLALALGGCGQKPAVNPAPTAGAPTNGTAPVSTQKISATALEMMHSGKALDCNYSFQSQQGALQSGEFFVDGATGRFRSDVMEMVRVPVPMNIMAYSISDGTYVYTWSSMNPKTGYKVNLSQTSPAAVPAATSSVQSTADLNQKIDYNCRPWTVDASKFTLPAGVQFTDMSQMINALKAQTAPGAAGKPGTIGSAPANACSVCQMIPDAKVKAQCQKANCK
jgi:predicted small lipoprotein YifL